jgi:hypothetical protein
LKVPLTAFSSSMIIQTGNPSKQERKREMKPLHSDLRTRTEMTAAFLLCIKSPRNDRSA